MTGCCGWSRWSTGCGGVRAGTSQEGRLGRVLRIVVGTAVGCPRWESLPELNRRLVVRLLGRLVERRLSAVTAPEGVGRGEQACGDVAVGTDR